MPSNAPWKDNKWLPGVLNKNQMIDLMEAYLLIDANKEIDESHIKIQSNRIVCVVA